MRDEARDDGGNLISPGLNQKHPRGSHGDLMRFVYLRPTNAPHWLLCSLCVYNCAVQTKTSKETIEKPIQCRDIPSKDAGRTRKFCSPNRRITKGKWS